MNYLYLGLAVLCIGFQFVFTKYYQSRAGKTFLPAVLFNVIAGAISSVLFVCVSGFKIRINVFSACMGIGFAVAMTAINCVSIFAMSCGKVSVYTLFMMLGGMLLPFVYGLFFLDESVGVCRWIALVLMIAAMLLPCLSKRGEKNKKRFYLFCLLAFVLNGAVSIISKAHQVSAHAVSTYDFLAFAYFCVFVLSGTVCAVYLLARKRARKTYADVTAADISQQAGGEQDATAAAKKANVQRIPSIVFVAAYAVSNGMCNMFQMLGARSLPAVLLYPVTTGGSIILTALLGRIFFKEKITLHVAMGIMLAFAATILFLF